MVAKRDFTLQLDSRLFAGRRFTSATLHQPRLLAKFPNDKNIATATPLKMKQTGKTIEIKAPALEVWGIVELK